MPLLSTQSVSQKKHPVKKALPTKVAVCIGVNKYSKPYPSLTKCVSDAKAWQALLTPMGFKCTMLLDLIATKAKIISTLTSVIANNRIPGSVIVITNSSHGSQVRDISGDEADGWDEVICSCDWPKYVSDDDLRTIFSKLASGVMLTVFLDCCHSGTGSRTMEVLPDSVLAVRSLPPLVEDRPNKGIVTTFRGLVEVPTLNHVLVAGCKDSEVSYELNIGGAFTYYTIQAIKLGYNRQKMIDYVQAKIAALGLTQTPQLECTQAESLHQPFL
jgi:hypothetical protein